MSGKKTLKFIFKVQCIIQYVFLAGIKICQSTSDCLQFKAIVFYSDSGSEKSPCFIMRIDW